MNIGYVARPILYEFLDRAARSDHIDAHDVVCVVGDRGIGKVYNFFFSFLSVLNFCMVGADCVVGELVASMDCNAWRLGQFIFWRLYWPVRSLVYYSYYYLNNNKFIYSLDLC